MVSRRFLLFLLCYLLCNQVKNVFLHKHLNSTVVQDSLKRHVYEGDTLLIEGYFLNVSDINMLMSNRTISKVHVYVLSTLYVDVDLTLKGIADLQIFANTWSIARETTFDLSGLDGLNQELLTVKGTAGNPGNSGMNGGNFFGLATETINGHFLTVKLNGGNGGNGQDGTASDDIQVMFNETQNSGHNVWSRSANLFNYYDCYFRDKGYNTNISEIDKYTTFHALFVHNKQANLQIRLHPHKCCGTTGMGGAGGAGGRRGTFVFKNIGQQHTNASPNFITNDGLEGKMGKDARVCKSTALDVRMDIKLANVVFIAPPVHYSFSTRFSIINQDDDPKCSTKLVLSNETLPLKPSKMETISPIIDYKIFLLKNMKRSLMHVTQRIYAAINSNSGINDEYTAYTFALEANELENIFWKVKNAVNVLPLYENLSTRVERSKDNDTDALFALKSILSLKIKDLRGDLDSITVFERLLKLSIKRIKRRGEGKRQVIKTTDVRLRKEIRQFELKVHANYILTVYYRVLDGYRRKFYPFDVEFLNMNDPSSLSIERDLHGIKNMAINNLKSLNES